MKHRLLLMAGVALGLMGCEDSSYPPLKCPEILDAPLLGQEYTKQGLTRVGPGGHPKSSTSGHPKIPHPGLI